MRQFNYLCSRDNKFCYLRKTAATTITTEKLPLPLTWFGCRSFLPKNERAQP